MFFFLPYSFPCTHTQLLPDIHAEMHCGCQRYFSTACSAGESVPLCKQSSCQAEKMEQMAAARCMLGFITVIFQKNTDSRADQRQSPIKHDRHWPVKRREKRRRAIFNGGRVRRHPKGCWRRHAAVRNAVFRGRRGELSDSAAGPPVTPARNNVLHPRAAGSRSFHFPARRKSAEELLCENSPYWEEITGA